ncbi:ADP-ribosylglycohydrolase family protein [Lichenicoccus sp.]|uniref:ADP-ribosylglycohydrolase family protein n=1 Tax=Lichenicoccus sp. TaxID=2781899 RepID=UPI003D123C34
MPPDYLTRVYAGVLGKLIGVYLGRPFEGWTRDRILRTLGPIEYYVHDRLGVPLVVTDDDIAGTFVFLRALEDHGYDRNLGSRQIGNSWLNYLVERRSILWWGGYGNSTEHTAYLRLKSGIEAPRSGSIAMNGRTVAEQIGAQIFIDGWAMVSPGNPAQAARLAGEAARVSHDGEAVHAAVLLAVMEALAFVERDIDRLLDAGLSHLPPDCLIATVVRDIRGWHAEHPRWEDTFRRIEARYGYHCFPGNCHVVPNHAVIIMSLLYGGDDFQRSQMVANSAGWDTDCNAGNVGCLNGIRLGLDAIDAGPDWRGPVADRLYLSSADGGAAIADAVGLTYAIARAGLTLSGEPVPPAPKQGARYHFSLPGSVQGFAPAFGSTATARVRHSHLGERALAVEYRPQIPFELARICTPTFVPPDIARMRTYELMASPTLNAGQIMRARVSLPAADAPGLQAALTLSVYGAGDALETITGAFEAVGAGGSVLTWTVPDLGSRPIAEAGIALRGADAAVLLLEWLDWSGAPDLLLTRPAIPGTFYRRAWVDAVTSWAGEPYPETYRLSQEQGSGLLIYGTRDWRDIRVSSRLVVNLGSGGIAVRVQGLRRYYALLLEAGEMIRLVRVLDDTRVVLAEASLRWRLDEPVELALQAQGDVLLGTADEQVQLQAQDAAFAQGAIAFCCVEGAVSADAIRISG